MTAALTINARHRRHYKSGSCLSQHALDRPLVISKKFARLLEYARELGKHDRNRLSVAAMMTPRRPVEAIVTPRTTQSLFGRVAAKVKGFFARRAA